MLKDVPLEHYKKLKKDEIQAFVNVRLFKTGNVPKGKSNFLLLNRSKIEDALNGKFNCIKMAYENRDLPIILVHPKVNNGGKVILGDDNEFEDVDEFKDDVEGAEVEVGEDNSDLPRLIIECPPRSTIKNINYEVTICLIYSSSPSSFTILVEPTILKEKA